MVHCTVKFLNWVDWVLEINSWPFGRAQDEANHAATMKDFLLQFHVLFTVRSQNVN